MGIDETGLRDLSVSSSDYHHSGEAENHPLAAQSGCFSSVGLGLKIRRMPESR